MVPTVILVTGIPGSGKSTLAKKLSKSLNLRAISKDEIKEFLHDKLGADDAEAAKMLGVISFDTLYAIIGSYLAERKSVIIECPFHVSFAKNRLSTILSEHPEGKIVELHCELSEATRKERFRNRTDAGERHPVHRHGDMSLPMPQDELERTYAPLEVGPVIRVNTEQFGEKEYNQLLEKIKTTLGDA